MNLFDIAQKGNKEQIKEVYAANSHELFPI
jgi:hypothetical protein